MNHRATLMATAAALLLFGACATDEGEQQPQAVASTTAPPTPTTEVEVQTTEEPAETFETVEIYDLPLFGGAEFAGPSGLAIEAPGEFRVIIAPPASDDEPAAVVLVARISQTASDQRIESIEQVIDHLEVASGATVTAEGLPIEAFGRKFDRFDFTGGIDAEAFSAAPAGFPTNAAWAPDPMSRMYLADLDDSVIAVVAMGSDEASLARSDALLRAIAPTMALTTANGQPAPLPSTDDVVELDFGPPLEVEPAEPVEGALALPEFRPIPAGLYELSNLGEQLTVDVPEQWAVQPNFPGFVVLTDEDSRGPYEDDVRIIVGLIAIAPVGAGELPIGDAVFVDGRSELEAFLENPPANLTLSNVDLDATVAGLSAIRFQATITDATTCSLESPCNYGFYGPAEPTLILADYAHEFWIVPDFEPGQLVIAVAAERPVADEWFERATPVIESITAAG